MPDTCIETTHSLRWRLEQSVERLCGYRVGRFGPVPRARKDHARHLAAFTDHRSAGVPGASVGLELERRPSKRLPGARCADASVDGSPHYRGQGSGAVGSQHHHLYGILTGRRFYVRSRRPKATHGQEREVRAPVDPDHSRRT